MIPHFAFHLIGSPRIELNGVPIKIRTNKVLALLVYLAVTRQAHQRDVLVALLWPEADTKRGRGSLRFALTHINKSLGKDFLLTDRQTVEINPAIDLWLDTALFREQISTSTTLQAAIDQYQAPFLSGFGLRDAPSFEEWQFFEREALHQTFIHSLQLLIQQLCEQQSWEKGIHYSLRWVNHEPLDEAAYRCLMQLYAQTGQRAMALRQFEQCRAILAAELGVTPSFETLDLYAKIESEEIETIRASLIEPLPSMTTKLPQAATRFVGRQQEIEAIRARLAEPHCRLLTLTGPGGIGKTRLAVQVARLEQSQWPDGIIYCDLVPLRTATSLVTKIAEAVAQTMSIHWREHQPLAEQLTYVLAEKRCLLLLDNFEHLLAGTPLIEQLLSETTQLKILITSREGLQLPAEWLYALTGLAYPTIADTILPDGVLVSEADYTAVQLFAQRAQQVSPAFSLVRAWQHVAKICQLVEGMPLALELAVPWVRLLSCAEIAQEIGNNLDFLVRQNSQQLVDRHRSLRAVFDYSWRLLSLLEQQTLIKLAVFAGGCRRDAAIEVTGATLFTLYSLVNKSLLRHEDGRYTLHELLRQFLQEKLLNEATLYATLPERHAAYYGAFLQKHDALWESDAQADVVALLQRDIQNIRLGWQWAAQQRHEEILNRYLVGVLAFYGSVNWYDEGIALLQTAVVAWQSDDSLAASVPMEVEEKRPWRQQRLLLAKIQSRQALFHHKMGHVAEAERLSEASLEVLRHFAEPEETGFAYNTLGMIALHQGRYGLAHNYLTEALAYLKETNYANGEATITLRLGDIAFAQGAFDEAQRWHKNSLDIYRTLKKTWGVAQVTHRLGMTAQATQAYEPAKKCYDEALKLFEQINYLSGVAMCLNDLGVLAQARTHYKEAQQYFLQSQTLCRENQLDVELARALSHLGDVSACLSEYEAAQTHLETALTIANEVQSPPLILQALLGSANLLMRMGNAPTGTADADNSQLKKAFALLRLVEAHPASYESMRQQARPRLTALRQQLPAHVVSQLEAQPSVHLLEASTSHLLQPKNLFRRHKDDNPY